jgi:hypothetical protein
MAYSRRSRGRPWSGDRLGGRQRGRTQGKAQGSSQPAATQRSASRQSGASLSVAYRRFSYFMTRLAIGDSAATVAQEARQGERVLIVIAEHLDIVSGHRNGGRIVAIVVTSGERGRHHPDQLIQGGARGRQAITTDLLWRG